MTAVTKLLPAVIFVVSAACSVSASQSSSVELVGRPVLQIDTDRFAIYAASGDRAAGAAEQVDSAALRFSTYAGAPPRKIAIVLFEAPEHMIDFDFTGLEALQAPVLSWISDEALLRAFRDILGPGVDASSLPLRALSHEACHLFLVAHTTAVLGFATYGERSATESESSYGDPLLPDWLDESAAVLCEPEETQAERRLAMREGIENRIPLAEFLSMNHPSEADEAEGPTPGEEPRSGASFTVRQVDVAGRDLFYPQALSFAEFLITHRSDAMGRIVEAYAAGGSLTEILESTPQFPSNLEQLEAHWIEWIRRQ